MPLFFNTPASPLAVPYAYLPDGWDTAWQTAKALSGTEPVAITAIGDSVTAGQGSSNILQTSWFALLRQKLLLTNTLGGDHYGWLYGPSSTSGYNPVGTPINVPGTFGVDYDWNYLAQNSCISNLQTETPLMSVTPSYRVVGFDILYLDITPGSWTYNVDGGANTTVTTTGNGTKAASTVKKASVTGLTLGTHTLNINSFSSSYRCNIIGVTAYASTSNGLLFANMGSSGMGLVNGYTSGDNNLATTGSFPPDRIALYQGYQGTTAAPSALTGLGFPMQPKLGILSFGINDAYNGTTGTQFRDSLMSLVMSLRFGQANNACSIIICAMWAPDGNGADSTHVQNNDYGGGASPYKDIRTAMLQVAQLQGCAYLDVHGLFGQYPVSSGLVTSTSNLHPTNLGHETIFQLVYSVL